MSEKKGSGSGSGTGNLRGNQRNVKVKNKSLKLSSRRWLQRQLNDPYVLEAQKAGFRSRAAFKLIEMDEQLHLIRPGMNVIDLGAAPGGWSQVAAAKGAHVVGLDLLPIDPLPGIAFLQMDFMNDDAPEALVTTLDGPADLVMSDMAPNTTGHQSTDHIRIMGLVEAAYDFALEVLRPGGSFVAKVFQGGTQAELLARMKRDFKSVKHIKPKASRKESAEQYVVATGFKGISE